MDPFTAIALGLGTAQAIAPLLPSKAKRLERERIEALEQQKGLSDEEKRALTAKVADPLARAAAEQRAADEGLLASTGMSSGAALDAVRRREQAATADATTRALQMMTSADAEQVRRDEAELAGLQANRAARNQEALGGILGAGSMISGALGQLRASAPAPDKQAQLQALLDQGYDAADARRLMQIDARTPGGLAAALRATFEGGPGTPGYDEELFDIANSYSPTTLALRGL